MNIRKKAMLMMFVDYLICLGLQLLGLLIFSWMFRFSWGYLAYSVIFILVLFGLVYSRAHNTAKRDLKHKIVRGPYTEGLLLALPLTAFNLLVIVLFALLQSNIIPIGDNVVKILYSFPENEPRVATEVLLIDRVTPVVRIWFSHLVGFMSEKTSAFTLLISPVVTILGGFFGYYAGTRKFYISEVIAKAQNKVKDKFNE